MEILGIIVIVLIVSIVGKALSGIAKLLPDTKEEKIQKQKELQRRNKQIALEKGRLDLGIKKPTTKYQHFPKIKYSNSFCKVIEQPSKWKEYKDKFSGAIDKKIGKCEYYFVQFLEKYIGNERISIRRYMCGWYYPDIVFADFENQVFIDIEIDEPYSYLTGDIIHTNEDDAERDKKITDLGWSIIRFSEKQIALYPKECCKKVSELIQYLTLNSNSLKLLNAHNDVEFDREWDYNKADEFCKSKYRDSYLGKMQNFS